MKKLLLVAISTLALGGCSTVQDWFTDDEELEIRKLKPIQAEFQAKTLWSRDVGDGVEDFFSRLRPAVAYNKVYVASREGDVKAFDKVSGKQIWSRDFADDSQRELLRSWLGYAQHGVSAKISGGLTVAYETLYFGTENGYVVALDEATGTTKWQAKVPGEVLSPPSVDAGVVVVNTGSGALVALNAADGSQAWISETDVPPLTLRGVSAPTAAAGGALVGTPAGKLQVNVLENGLVAWEATIAAPTGATELERIVDVDTQPLVFGANVYVVSYNGALAAIELRTGRVVWTREYGSYRNLSIAGNRIFVTDSNSSVFAIDLRNGVELWSNSNLRSRGLTAATPIGEHIVLGDKFGFLHWISQDEGKLVARYAVGDDDTDEAVYVAPIADEQRLYVQTRDGRLSVITR